MRALTKFLACYFVLALTLFASWQAGAQFLLLQSGASGKGGGAAYQGPGDIVSGATAWYGLRAYTAAAASSNLPAVNIRNSVSNETCDVLLSSTGGLSGIVTSCSGSSSGDAISVFCALSGSTTCLIAELYDQSGNANHASQVTLATQNTFSPSCLGSFYCSLQTSGATGNYTGTTNVTPSSPVSLEAVAFRSSTDVGSGGCQSWITLNGTATGSDSLNGAFTTANTTALSDSNVGQINATAADDAWHTINGLMQGASSVINVDGTETSGTRAVGTAVAAPTVLQTFSCNSTGDKWLEGGAWNTTAFTPTQRTDLCHNAFTYWGTPNSC